jgi:hypothetical protein
VAPADVRPAWESLSSTAATVQDVVRKAGLELKDLENPESLGGLSSKQQRILTEGLQGVDIAGLQQDSAVITEQVGELCGLQLSPGRPLRGAVIRQPDQRRVIAAATASPLGSPSGTAGS